jgi:hypothetical protein
MPFTLCSSTLRDEQSAWALLEAALSADVKTMALSSLWTSAVMHAARNLEAAWHRAIPAGHFPVVPKATLERARDLLASCDRYPPPLNLDAIFAALSETTPTEPAEPMPDQRALDVAELTAMLERMEVAMAALEPTMRNSLPSANELATSSFERMNDATTAHVHRVAKERGLDASDPETFSNIALGLGYGLPKMKD